MANQDGVNNNGDDQGAAFDPGQAETILIPRGVPYVLAVFAPDPSVPQIQIRGVNGYQLAAIAEQLRIIGARILNQIAEQLFGSRIVRPP